MDTCLRIDEGVLKSNLYVKLTDGNQLLYHKSFHTPGVFKSIPKSQLTHVKRIVSDQAQREKWLDEMEDKLIGRDYPRQVIGRVRKE